MGCVVAGLTSMATCNYKLTNQFVIAVVIHGAVVDCTIVVFMGIYRIICRPRFIIQYICTSTRTVHMYSNMQYTGQTLTVQLLLSPTNKLYILVYTVQ